MSDLFLHMGLHKTGTKFFQHRVFPFMPETQFIYNPPRLTQLCCDLMKADEVDFPVVVQAIVEEKKKLRDNYPGKKIVLSREILSGDLFSFYKNFENTAFRLKQAFSEATIICFLRFQYDWLLSCYRESVHEHHHQTFSSFLGLSKSNKKFVSADYKDFDLEKIISKLEENFSNRVHFFFFEKFKEDKLEVIKEIANIFGMDQLKVKGENNSIPNRGYSAFSIYLSIFRYNLLKISGLSGMLVHRPIRFFGENSIPAGFSRLSVLPKEKYWHKGFKKDNEEIRSDNYPNLTFYEKLRQIFSWRKFIKSGVDRLFYWDWPLLDDVKQQEVMECFKAKNREMFKRHRDILSNMPKSYFE